MNRRDIIIIVTALVLCAFSTTLLWPEKAEPVYKGKRLSDWIVSARMSPTSVVNKEALRAIGTNGIPYYLEWIRYERKGFVEVFQVGLARVCRAIGSKYVDRPAALREGTRIAFSELGTNATGAIPALEQCVTDSKSPVNRGAALLNLAAIGNNAATSYVALMTNADPSVRMQAVAYAFMFEENLMVREQLSRSLQDRDALVRSTAATALNYLTNNAGR